jgi:hypothetical protein
MGRGIVGSEPVFSRTRASKAPTSVQASWSKRKGKQAAVSERVETAADLFFDVP